MEGETSGGYNHQRGKAVTGNDYNDKNTTAATTIMRSCSSCNLGVLCRMLTKINTKQKTVNSINDRKRERAVSKIGYDPFMLTATQWLLPLTRTKSVNH